MSFNDLENILKTLFQGATRTGNLSHKANLKNLCLSTLSAPQMPWWKAFILGKFAFQVRSAFAAVLVFGVLFSLFQNQSYAGDVQPTFGLVELTRDGQTRIIREKTKLKVGDIVQVASSAQAKISLKNNTLQSDALPHTEVRIMDKNKIFLSEGTLENNIQKNAEIATKRGKVSAQNGKGIVSVTQTGETNITAVTNKLKISDWLDRSTSLSSGETIKLTTDSNLSNTKSNKNSGVLSVNIINKVKAKLLISQTKILNGIHTMNQEKSREAGQQELASAERSFKAIYSIINQSITGKKTNAEQISPAQVIEIIENKSKNKTLITEAKATLTLLEKSQNEGVIFTLANKEHNPNFYKHQIIEKIFNLYAPKKVSEKQALQSKYIARAQAEFAELNSKTEQKAYLSKIPQNTFFRSLVEAVQE